MRHPAQSTLRDRQVVLDDLELRDPGLRDAIGLTLSEALRSAGDTMWIAVMRLVLSWLVFAPASYVVVKLGGGAIGAIICVVGYFALVALASMLRFHSGAWRKIELIDERLV